MLLYICYFCVFYALTQRNVYETPHIIAFVTNPFLFTAEFDLSMRLSCNVFDYSLDGCLDSLPCLSIINKTTVNILVQVVLVDVCFLFLWVNM